MQKPRFTEAQIIAVLNEADEGMKVKELCSKHGISDATFYKWRAKHGEKASIEARRIKKLEDENQRLKALVADLTLRNQALKHIVSKKW